MAVSPAALVCSTVPAVRAEYQVKVPAVALPADKVTVPVPHLPPGVTVGAPGIVFTVATMAVRGALSHVPFWKVT